MKKVSLTLIALIVFTFSMASCGRSDFIPGPVSTAIPLPPIDLSPITGDSEETVQPSSSANEENSIDLDFEHLRSAALDAVPDDGTLDSAVTRWLISCDKDTITLALPIRLPDMEGDIDGGTSRRYHVMEVAACKYYVKDGKLHESETYIVPILVKVKKDSATIENVSVPDFMDSKQREKDIKNIFGVESESELSIWPSDELHHEKDIVAKKLCELKFNIALKGGYDKYPNLITEAVKSLSSAGHLECETEQSALLNYLIKNNFYYRHTEIPLWHEIGREYENGNTDSITVYAVLYIGYIKAESGYYAIPKLATIKFNVINGLYSVERFYEVEYNIPCTSKDFDASMGDYACDFAEYLNSKDYSTFSDECNSIFNTIAFVGTFDFEKDTLIYSR